MNLTNLFNIKFLKENMKRSKAVVLLLIFLIPVLNVIIYLMNIPIYRTLMPTIMEVQPLSLIGMYVIPIILSIMLFSFIYKRKSSDFVMSFPVSKKQIFISNTIGGIVVIVVMNLINYLFSLIATLLVNNFVLIDYRMLFDMFILWTISYIFVFTSTNIAVALASNKITTVVVTLLILFLVPFTHTFLTSDSFKGISNSNIPTYCNNDACRPKNYECYDTSCEINKRKDIYEGTTYREIEENANYTMPYAIIREGIFGEGSTNINKSMLKMTFLSVVYIIVGLMLFLRKKFEVVEISFKTEKVHNFVRNLTTVPMLCIYYIILKNSSIGFSDIFSVVFLFALILTYVIIYDLLTRKKVTNIFKTLASLIIVGIIVIFTGELSSREIEYIDVNKINKMTFEKIDLLNTGGYTNNKNLINYVMSIQMDNILRGENYRNTSIKINLDNKTYQFRIAVTESQYNYILETLSRDDMYQKTSEEVKDNDVFAIELNGDSTYVSKDNELYVKIIDKFRNSKIIKTDNLNYLFTANIYIYDDFNTDVIYLNIEDDTELLEDFLNYYNKETKKTFEDPELDIASYYIGKTSDDTIDEVYYSSYEFNYSEITNFILDNLDEKVDITKQYMYIKIYSYNGYKSSNIFVTNKVKELEDLIERIENKEDTNTGDTDGKYTY